MVPKTQGCLWVLGAATSWHEARWQFCALFTTQAGWSEGTESREERVTTLRPTGESKFLMNHFCV